MRQIRDSFWYSQTESDRLRKVKITGVCQGRYKPKMVWLPTLFQAVLSQYTITQHRQQFVDGQTLRVRKLGLLSPGTCVEDRAGALGVPLRTPGSHSSPTDRVWPWLLMPLSAPGAVPDQCSPQAAGKKPRVEFGE